MDKSKGVIADPLTDYKPESVKSVIPEINGLLTSYKTKDLIDRFDSIKLIPEVLLEDIEKECGECDGEGEVEWGYGNHIKYDTCPECYGQCVYEDTKEVVTGEMVKEEGLIKIGNSTFATSIIGKIVDFAKEVNSKTIKLVHQSHDRAASVLEIEGVRFLIMPNISENLELKIIIWVNFTQY